MMHMPYALGSELVVGGSNNNNMMIFATTGCLIILHASCSQAAPPFSETFSLHHGTTLTFSVVCLR
jgi:hypothetical protein